MTFPDGKYYEDVAVMHLILAQSETTCVIASPKYHYRQRTDSIVRGYSARNLIDYADARLIRFHFIRENCGELFLAQREEIMLTAADSLSRVWRHWYGCSRTEKKEHRAKIREYVRFAREYLPLLGCRAWQRRLRMTTLLMHTDSGAAFALLYLMNRLFRLFHPENLFSAARNS